MFGEAATNVERDILFTRSKTNQHPCGLAAAGINDVVFAEANDAAPPHARRGLGGGLHDVDNRETVFA